MKSPIVLINLPSLFLIDDRVFPNLGLLKVATSLRKGGVDVEVLDLSGHDDYKNVLNTFLNNTPMPAIFGISATTPQIPSAISLAKIIKEHSEMNRILLGGPHGTLVNAARKWELKTGSTARGHRNYAQLLQYFDTIVAGDGERAIFDAIKPDAPALIDADDRMSKYFMSANDLDFQLPPNRNFIDIKSYSYSIDGLPATSIITQSGCPFKCGFCGGRHTSVFRGARNRRIDVVMNEILMLYNTYGYRGFMFYDDELNVNPLFADLMEALVLIQEQLGVQFAFRGFIKSELFTNKQAELMRKAGFRWILSGFESGSERMLRNMQKTAKISDNTNCIEIARSYGLKVKALMSIGHPGESRESIGETANWLQYVKPEDFDITIITPYPGSDYFDKAIPHHKDPGVWIYTSKASSDKLYSIEVDYANTSNYYKGIPGVGYSSYVFTDDLSCEDMVTVRDSLDFELRASLGLAPVAQSAIKNYEHSMGQSPVGLDDANLVRS